MAIAVKNFFLLQIANPQICGLKFFLKICTPSANVAISRFAICGPDISLQFVNLQFADPNADLKIPQISKY
jgi:hypothetical protein